MTDRAANPERTLPTPLGERLAGTPSVGVITGAGISRESGIRTYRGEGGLYDDPAEGDRTVEALSGHTFRADPDRTWRVVAELARQAADAAPNAAHRALVEIEERVERFVLLTQNVDGLHRAAGSRRVIEIHGDVLATCCTSCGARSRLQRTALAGLDRAPRCATCGGVIRPDVVLFGETLPSDKVLAMQEELYRAPPALLLVVGTTALFPYITEPVLAARAAGRLTVEINPDETLLSPIVDWTLRGPAGAYLPLVARAL